MAKNKALELTKATVVDMIEVVGTDIQVRTATVINEGDQELSRSFHRHTLHKGDSLKEEDAKVAAVAKAVWSL